MAEISNPGLSQAAVQALIPQPASTPPMSERTAAATGSQTTRYALEDHQHPRLTSTTVQSVASGNTADVLFTRAFANEPGIDYQELPPTASTTTPDAADTAGTAQPTQCKVISWTRGPTATLPTAAATDYTGCKVRVWRGQVIPQNLATLLLGAVYNVFGAGVVGTRFSLIAVARSDV